MAPQTSHLIPQLRDKSSPRQRDQPQDQTATNSSPERRPLDTEPGLFLIWRFWVPSHTRPLGTEAVTGQHCQEPGARSRQPTVKAALGKGLGTLRSGVLATHVIKPSLSHSWVCPAPDAMPPPTSNPKRQLTHECKTLLPSILGLHTHQSGLIWFIWVQPAQIYLGAVESRLFHVNDLQSQKTTRKP